MDQFRIEGGIPLRGSVQASGSKNSVLALMAASLLSDEPVVLANAPRVRDLDTEGWMHDVHAVLDQLLDVALDRGARKHARGH